jgi:carboxypeptidase family protein
VYVNSRPSYVGTGYRPLKTISSVSGISCGSAILCGPNARLAYGIEGYALYGGTYYFFHLDGYIFNQRYTRVKISRISHESMTQTAVEAQTTGSLSGTVTDPNGAVMSGATVTLLSNGATRERSAITERNGAFDFQALLSGTYTVNFEATGFKKAITHDIVI